ncbi:related to MRPL17 - mitochondrial ribosomal protein, large subunit [Melanopsichium pennsylvanicum]|uniref:Large ribosomal subunit protein mL46 n=2 Tax=Melanopsichium pennsylvanicum TaxID=63383 RepID=A0AAJ4XPC9_9BASI|nr:related to MRPL17-mitochondrial ribosomal protein, large subunit [Melanopsichium pennsylvanicum 4]SNX86679.1 related to MRPL17 - mitochondrial ribosomal protein, large subunit [Melanopsichium pennsylvanicum]
MSATRAAAPRLRLLQSRRCAQRLLHSTPTFATPSSASTSTATLNEPLNSTKIISSLILSRPPVVLREPTLFEKAYHEYNRQLSEALQQPFPKDFYFKKGSAAEKRFEEDQASSSQGFSAIAAAASSSAPKGKGAKGKDTAAAGAPPSAPAATTSGVDGAEDARPLSRTTEADVKNDVKSLERKLDRTLYLVVKQKQSGKGSASWMFPAKALENLKHQNLHDIAPTAVTDTLGNNMDIWLVSNLPVGLYKSANSTAEKTYFLRAHVLAGNAELAKKDQVEEFQWLTKEEIEKLMDSNYWKNVQDLLDP